MDGELGGVAGAELVREGEYWTFSFAGRDVRVRDSKGLGYLAELLEHPGVEIEALALASGGSGDRDAGAQAAAAGLSFAADSDAGPVLDERAKSEYGARLEGLREEIEEAESFHDPERASRAREEYAAIAEQLAAATGLGGRDRRVGSATERARLNVTRALKSAITRIGEHDDTLAEHLSSSVQTGRICVYRPEQEPAPQWRVHTQGLPAAERSPRPQSPTAPDTLEPLPLPPRLGGETEYPFVGRHAALGWLIERLDAAGTGQASLALVSGEAGIGKTRLVAQLARRAHERGTTVLYGGCEEEALVPFQPWVQALDGYAAAAPLQRLRDQLAASGGELARLLPALPRRLPDLPAPAAGDAIAERYWLFEAVRELLAHIAHDNPVLLVLDDLHWADAPTVLMLKHLVRARMEAPILIVGAYRGVELSPGHPMAEALLALGQEGLADRLTVDGMEDSEVAEMIEALTGRFVAADVATTLRERTEGHPLFLAEVVRDLRERGALDDQGPGMSRPDSARAAGIPARVKEVVGERLRRLDAPTRRVLAIASVIGRVFSADVLERVCELGEAELFERLEAAARAHVIAESPVSAASYVFAHALVRDTLYDGLTGPHRARLHERIARAYEVGEEADLEQHLGELAHHYFNAATSGDVLMKAADYSARAGDQAAQQLAYEEAAAHYGDSVRALAMSGKDPPRRCRLLLAQGDNLMHSGEFRRAEAAFREAAELAERLGLAEELARAALGVTGELGNSVVVHNPELVALMERALSQLNQEDTPLRARLTVRLAEAIAFSPRREQAQSLAREAIAMARRVGDSATLAEVLSASQQACRGPDTTAAQLEVVRESERLARASGSTRALVESLWWQFGALAELGEIAQARSVSEKMTPVAEQLRQPYYGWMDAVPKAAFAFLDRPLREIEPLIWHAGSIGREVENRISLTFWGVQIAVLRMLEGRHAEMRAGSQGFADAAPGIPGLRCALAVELCELGLEADARRELERLAVNDFGEIPRDYVWFSCMEFLADVCAHLGDERRALTLYEQLLPFADRYVVLGHFGVLMGSAHRPLAILAATCGQTDRAVDHFETALAQDQITGSPYAVAKSKYEYANLLRRRGADGDHERVDGLLGDARQIATRFGMGGLETKLRALDGDSKEATHKRQGLRERTSLAASEAKAAVTIRGRDTIARVIADSSDAELERRFGSPLAQRALFAAMARSFQPRLAFGFRGEISIELEHPAAPATTISDESGRPSDWWTLRVRRGKASATRGAAQDPAVTIHTSLPAFVRLVSGLDTPMAAALWYRIRAEGDLVLGSRLTEMFGAVNPADVLGETS